MGLTIEDMRLSQNAKRAASLMLSHHPTIVFTSGRRDVRDQARAMAQNTIRYGVDWLGQTYRNQEMVRSLEEWIATHLDQTASEKLMTEGFYATLMTTQAGQFAQFPHCRGDAFDIQCPRYESGQINELEVTRIKRTLETLPNELGLQLIMTREGAHRIIHAQFNHLQEPVSI